MVECGSVGDADGDIRWVVLRHVFQQGPEIEITCNISIF